MIETRYYYPGRVYESAKGRFKSFVEAVPEKLTVRREPSFLFRMFRRVNKPPYNGIYETVFHEVRKVPIRELWTPEFRSLIYDPIERLHVSFENFVDIVFGAFIKAIEDYWISDKFHIVLHSAGLDSRMISMAIKKLYEKNGKDWLGEVLFYEVNFEDKWFEQIMEIEGWDESQYMVYNKDAPLDEKHSRSFDFKNAWRKLGGVSCFPVNWWWDPIAWLQEQGIAPGDGHLQGLSGLGADPKYAIHVEGQERMELKYRERYHCCGYTMPLKGDWMMPFVHPDFVRVLIKYGSGQPATRSDGYYNKAILDHIAPELDEVEYFQAGFGKLSDGLFQQVIRDYGRSWYGSEVRPIGSDGAWVIKPTWGIGYGRWWGFWCLASFCDHLLEMGHEITPD